MNENIWNVDALQTKPPDIRLKLFIKDGRVGPMGTGTVIPFYQKKTDKINQKTTSEEAF